MKASLFAAVASVALATAQTCTTSSCATYCQTYDSILATCATNNGGFDSDVSCYCEAAYGLKEDTGILNLCVACNQNGLGASDLSIYQIGTVICDSYLSQGEAAAASVGSMQVSDIIKTYSSTYLPIIQSGLCTAGVPHVTSATGAYYYSSAKATVAGSQIGGIAGTNSGTAVSLPASTSVAVAGTLIPGNVNSNSGATTSAAAGTTAPAGTTTAQSLAAQSAISSHAAAPRNWQAANIALMAVPIVGALV